MGDAKYLDLIAKYLSGNIEDTERKNLLEWAAASEDNKLFFDEMIQLWSISADYDETFETDVDAAWDKLDQKLEVLEKPAPIIDIQKEKEAKVVRFSPFRWVARAAAVLLVLAAGYWWLLGPDGTISNNQMALETGAGERKEITLPDGSLVVLNENSSFSYHKKFEERTVYLEGEAYFDVERMEENPFTILSGDAKTTVLGTVFNVRAYPNEERVEVTVEEGKVRLEEVAPTEDQKTEVKEVILDAGKAGHYLKETNEVKLIGEQDPNTIAWKTRQFKFEDDRLEDVFKTFERYYNVKITVSNPQLNNCPWTAKPGREPELLGMLETMAFSIGFEIVPIEGGYIIEGDGCR